MSGVSLTIRTWQITGARSAKLREASARMTSALTRTSWGKPWVSMPKQPPGKRPAAAWNITMRVRLETLGSGCPEGAFERHHRHAASAPVDQARVPRRRVGHLRRRLIADHFGDAGPRHDQSARRSGAPADCRARRAGRTCSYRATALRRFTRGSMRIEQLAFLIGLAQIVVHTELDSSCAVFLTHP